MKQNSSAVRNSLGTPVSAAGRSIVSVTARTWRQPGGSTDSIRHRRPYAVTELSRSQQTAATDRSLPGRPGDEPDPRLGRMRVEAVLLMSKTPVNPRKLAQLAHLADATEARTLVRQLNQVYDTLGRALRVEQVAGGYRLMTRPELAPWLARLGHVPAPLRLSTPMMETLAVIAYRQPVSRANAESIRGVACGELLRQLMERELIRIVGRGEELGRPYLYGTTKRFLQLFGLPNVSALPPIQWEALQDDPIAEDSPPDDLSTSTKEPVVSTTIAPVLTEAVLTETETELEGAESSLAPPAEDADDVKQPVAVDDEEDEDFYDDDDAEDDDDDWDDDDWDDEDDDEEVDDDEDDDLEDEDDLEEEDWEEVEGDDDEEDWDEEEDDDWDDDDDAEEDDDEEWD